MPFEKGRAKTGGRQKGTPDKKDVAREQLTAHALQVAGLSPLEIDALTPLAVMRLVMTARWRAGDHAGALLAAEAAAPYVHPRLAAADIRVISTADRMSDEELKNEILLLEQRIKAAETVH